MAGNAHPETKFKKHVASDPRVGRRIFEHSTADRGVGRYRLFETGLVLLGGFEFEVAVQQGFFAGAAVELDDEFFGAG